jgi:lipopolysaccharide export system protein LptA
MTILLRPFRLAALFAFGAVALASIGSDRASAQDLGSFDLNQPDAPIVIEAEKGIEWRRDEQVYIATGNAMVARGDIAVHADLLMAYYRGDGTSASEIYRVEATGNVRMVSPGETVYGEYAVYDVERRVLVVTGGNLKVETANEIVTAKDSLEYWQDEMVVVARGAAQVVQPDHGRNVQAETLTGFFRENAEGEVVLYQVEAAGNVRIERGQEVARAAKAVYNLDEEVATLTGGVRITQGQNQLNGDSAEFNLRTGVSRLLGSGTDDGRVQTLIVPGSSPP